MWCRSYRSEDVMQTLDRVCGTIGYPKTIRVDQDRVRLSRPRHLVLLCHKLAIG